MAFQRADQAIDLREGISQRGLRGLGLLQDDVHADVRVAVAVVVGRPRFRAISRSWSGSGERFCDAIVRHGSACPFGG